MDDSTARGGCDSSAASIGGEPRSGLTHGDRHDLRGTLSAIQAFAELLEDEISGPLNASQHDHVRRILRNVETLSRQLDALRDRQQRGMEAL
jgi:signal transduction histidine kinase